MSIAQVTGDACNTAAQVTGDACNRPTAAQVTLPSIVINIIQLV